MKPSDLILTAENKLRGEFLKCNDNYYLTKKTALEFLSLCGRELKEKDIDFRRNEVEIGGRLVEGELAFTKQKGSRNKIVCKLQEIENYILSLYLLSTNLIYADARSVVEQYDKVLLHSRKHGMRGQRNFTGKIEDEVRGKMVELGFSKFILEKTGIDLPVDFELLEDTSRRRDYGDFIKYVLDNKIYDLPEELTISIKSTNGNFLAVPEVELSWEGNIFVLAKLHVKETFLYKAIKAGLQLGNLNMNEAIGWFEIRGFVLKDDFTNLEKSSKGVNFPGKYKLESDFRNPNFIMHPNQLNKNADDLIKLINRVKE